MYDPVRVQRNGRWRASVGVWGQLQVGLRSFGRVHAGCVEGGSTPRGGLVLLLAKAVV